MVEKVLAEHWDGTLPVRPEAIARAMGAEVYLADGMGNLSGQFDVRDGKPEITINAQESKLRQRFTAAHELGHFVLDHGTSFRDTASSFSLRNHNHLEVAANQFAAELLMPAPAVNAAISRVGVHNIKQLAALFAVSEVAMEYRLKNLKWLR